MGSACLIVQGRDVGQINLRNHVQRLAVELRPLEPGRRIGRGGQARCACACSSSAESTGEGETRIERAAGVATEPRLIHQGRHGDELLGLLPRRGCGGGGGGSLGADLMGDLPALTSALDVRTKLAQAEFQPVFMEIGATLAQNSTPT